MRKRLAVAALHFPLKMESGSAFFAKAEDNSNFSQVLKSKFNLFKFYFYKTHRFGKFMHNNKISLAGLVPGAGFFLRELTDDGITDNRL